jgi:hypothetical protein
MADIFDEITGGEPSVTGPKSDIFDQITGGQRMPEGFMATVADELSKAGGEIVSGISAQKAIPDLDSILGILQMAGGAARGLNAIPTGAGASVGQTVQDVTQPYLGATGSAIPATIADVATQFLTGGALSKLVGKAGSLATRAATPFFEAQATNAANQAAYAADMQQYLKAVASRGQQAGAARQAAQANAERLAQAEGLISRPGSQPLTRTSPLAESYRIPGTSEDIYAGVKAAIEEPVSLPGTAAKIDEMLARMSSPGVAAGLTPKSATRATEDLGEAILQGSFQSPDQGALAALREMLGQKGQLSLGDVQTNLQGIGRMTRSTDSRISAIGKQLYRSMTDDLEKAGPAGQALLEANRNFRRNLAVDDLANVLTKYGTDVDKLGNLKAAGKLSGSDPAARFIRKNFSQEELAGIQKTLEEIGMLKRTAADLPAVKGPNLAGLKEPKLAAEVTTTAPSLRPTMGTFISGAAMQAAAAALGLGPIGHVTGVALAEAPKVYSNLIFRLAANPTTQPLLRTIFRGEGPNLRNVAQIQAVANAARALDQQAGTQP